MLIKHINPSYYMSHPTTLLITQELELLTRAHRDRRLELADDISELVGKNVITPGPLKPTTKLFHGMDFRPLLKLPSQNVTNWDKILI